MNGIVISGTIRDSVYILECLLEQRTSLNPVEIMTDSASYSDLMFGCFWLLGYQLSPRLADIGETRFWRIDPHADYGPLNGLARNRINLDLIVRNWDDMLRVAGSLKLGTVSASTLIKKQQGSRREPCCFAEVCGSSARRIDSEDSSRLQKLSRRFAPFHE